MSHSFSIVEMSDPNLLRDRPPEKVLETDSNWDKRSSEERLSWFAISVKPRHEKKVAYVLETKGYETFVPLQRQRHRPVARVSELPIFPGYVFSRFDLLRRLPVVMTPGVNRILGLGHQPTPLDPSEITSLRTTLEKSLSAAAVPFLETGNKVRISDGPLNGVEGIIVAIRDTARIVLNISLLQRSVLAEVDSAWLLPEHGRSGDTAGTTQKGSIALASSA